MELEVVGVAGNVGGFEVGSSQRPFFWTSLDQDPATLLTVILEGSGSAEELVPLLREVVVLAEGEQPIVVPQAFETLLAFDQAMPLHVTVIGYSLSDVLGGVSSLPAGLLVTETSLSALLANAGLPLPVAVAATLTFRLITLWLPRTLGLGTLYNLQRRSARPLW